MRTRVLLAGAIVISGCSDAVLLIPPAPPGAIAVAIVSHAGGELRPLPLDGPIYLPEGRIEAHFFDVSLRAAEALPATTPVDDARGCEAGGLPPPIARYDLATEGATLLADERRLRATDLECVATTDLVVATIETGVSCRRATLENLRCGMEINRSACTQAANSTWPTMLDGTPCGPREDDPVCAPLATLPPQSLAAGVCDAAGYAIYRPRPLALDVEHIPFPAPQDLSRPFDFVVTSSAIVISSSRLLEREVDCDHAIPSSLQIYNRQGGTFTNASGPPCMMGMVPGTGGFWSTFQASNDVIGVGWFDLSGHMVRSTTVSIPAEVRPSDLQIQHVFDMRDTTLPGQPPELTALVTLESLGGASGDVTVFLRFDARTLRPIAITATRGSPRGVAADNGQLLLSDDGSESVRFFRLPIEDPLVEEDLLRNEAFGSVSMGPILAASDLRLWLVGRAGDTPGLDIYDSKNATLPLARTPFVLSPLASPDGIVRVDATHALAIFHANLRGATTTELQVWATLLDLEHPESQVAGLDAAPLGVADGAPGRVTLDDEGVVWLLLPHAFEVASVRLP